MKYNELERKVKKIGCENTGREMNGHPLRYSPVTKKYFQMSHHGGEEVAPGTLNKIKKAAGLK